MTPIFFPTIQLVILVMCTKFQDSRKNSSLETTIQLVLLVMCTKFQDSR